MFDSFLTDFNRSKFLDITSVSVVLILGLLLTVMIILSLHELSDDKNINIGINTSVIIVAIFQSIMTFYISKNVHNINATSIPYMMCIFVIITLSYIIYKIHENNKNTNAECKSKTLSYSKTLSMIVYGIATIGICMNYNKYMENIVTSLSYNSIIIAVAVFRIIGVST